MNVSGLVRLFATRTSGKHLLSPTCKQSHNSLTFAKRFGSNFNQWSFSNLNPYGRLHVKKTAGGTPVNFGILPVNPQECPSQDTASVRLEENSSTLGTLKCELDRDVLQISHNHDRSTEVDESQNGSAECHAEIPIKYDVKVELEGYNGVSVAQLENQDVDLQLQHGQCHLKNLKTGNVQIRTSSGDVISKSLLQGNTFIQSDQGNISLHKPVGPSITVQTSEGNIHVQNLYGDRSVLKTNCGDVNIGSCHGDVQVEIGYQGNLQIGSLDGRLNAVIKSGNVDVYISKHEWINISNENGDITVKLSEDLSSTLDASGESVTLDKQLVLHERQETKGADGQVTVKGVLHGASTDDKGHGRIRRLEQLQMGHIRVNASRGNVHITCQDWLSSLKIGQLSFVEE